MRRLKVTIQSVGLFSHTVEVAECWRARHLLRAMQRDYAADTLLAVDRETGASVYSWARGQGVFEDLLETLLWEKS